jgi:Tfp pilus assembly protein PilF
MRRWAILLLVIGIGGCAAPPRPAIDEPVFDDPLFAPRREAIDDETLFALNPAMRRYLDTEIAARVRRHGPEYALVEALYTEGDLKIRYDAEGTRTAAQTFESRAGNCLSLVIMTAAFAKAMGLEVNYQSLRIDETWGRRGDLVVSYGHVNVTLSRHKLAARRSDNRVDSLTIDFLRPAEMQDLRAISISEDTVVAMFMNNLAAEALAAGQVDEAYWWARAAIERDRHLMIAYNTLGVVYRRHGDAAQAERVFRLALQRDANNTALLGNLAELLAWQGRGAEAQVVSAQLARLQPTPPFADFKQGLAAMRAGDYAGARALFERELRRDPDYHEFHYWLAMALVNLGDVGGAREHLALAASNSTTRGEQSRYASKLQQLKSSQLQ